jgi:hexosaminidase
MWEEEGWGYALFADQEALTTEFERLYDIIREAAATRGLSAAVYTQTTDIETENNGLLTYDREVLKIAPEAVRLAQQGYVPPRVASAVRIFIDRMPVEFSSPDSQATVRYTIDGSVPTATSRQYEGTLELTETTTVRAKSYWPEGQESRVASWTFTKVAPKAAATIAAPHPGLQVEIYEHSGDWRALPDFGALEPTESRTTNGIGIDVTDRRELFGLRFVGYLDVPTTGVYGFHLSSDDGSRLAVDGAVLIDNDGIHGDRRRSGYVALEAGLHSLELVFFQGRGGVALALGLEGPGMEEQPIPAGLLRH